MNDNQLMSMIVDRLDRIERKLDNLPQCHYPEVKEQLARGRDRFDKLENKVEKCVKKEDVTLVHKTIAVVGVAFGAVIAWVSVKLTGG